MEVQKHSSHTLVFRSLKRTHDMFLSEQLNPPPRDETADEVLVKCKVRDEYGLVKDLVDKKNKSMALMPTTQRLQNEINGTGQGAVKGPSPFSSIPGGSSGPANGYSDMSTEDDDATEIDNVSLSQAQQFLPNVNKTLVTIGDQNMLMPKKAPVMPKPVWHPPWTLCRVISGHQGWVRCVDVEPGNEWFVTGSSDRIIKIWDLSSGTLRLSLTGHVSTVRGVVVSKNQPYLFSCGEDKQVKCWDLEQNKVVRHYHGHLSACYSIDLHPTLDLLVTCGRDATARVWDIRTKTQIHCLTGHTNTVAQVRCQGFKPEVITASHDSTVRFWDIAMGRSYLTLTNHKKSVRAIAIHPTLNMMASASPDNIKQWKLPDGVFTQNLSGHNAIVNTLACNRDGVLMSGGDNGTMYFWDWKSGYNFQRLQAAAQPGSIDSEAGIFASTFDKSESRLITCETDKTIKIYKENESATEESHPVNWKPDIMRKKF